MGLAIDTPGYADVAALSAVTTTISAAAGVISAVFVNCVMDYAYTGAVEYDLSYAMNGGLSGLVAITANCCVVTPPMAVLIGLNAGLVYIACSNLLVKLKIDDAVDAIPVHLGNGIWGCIAVGLFASPELADKAYGTGGKGVFYDTGDWNLFAANICGVIWIIGWVSLVMIPYFLLLNALGMFRVDSVEEEVGLDISHHKGAAYDLSGPTSEQVENYEIST